jgi:hypothetical protein
MRCKLVATCFIAASGFASGSLKTTLAGNVVRNASARQSRTFGANAACFV